MKYVLIDKGDNIIDATEINGGLKEAKEFFLGRKRIDKKEFDNIWKVMSKNEYYTQLDLTNRQNKQYEWWLEDKEITDDELKT